MINRRTPRGLNTAATVSISDRSIPIYPREQRTDGMISRRYIDDGAIAPEVNMTGWLDQESAPQLVLNNRAGLVSAPGSYPILDNKGYVQPVTMRESFTSIDDALANPTMGYRQNPESVMLDRSGVVMDSRDVLAQNTPQISENPSTWVDSENDQVAMPFFAKSSELQLFPQSELADPNWRPPATMIDAGSVLPALRTVRFEGETPNHQGMTVKQIAQMPGAIVGNLPSSIAGNQALPVGPNPLGRDIAFTVQGQRGYQVAPANQVQGLVDAGIAKSVVPSDEIIYAGPTPVPPAFQQAQSIQPTRGYDITTENNPQAFKPSEWERDITVQLPSTVLADKGLSPYDLTLTSTVDSQTAKTFPGRLSRAEQRALPETSREGMGDYVQAVRRGEGYEYIQPTVDAQDVLDRLGVAQRRANTGYASERDRLGRSIVGMTPQQASSAAMVVNALNDDLSPELRDKLTMARYKLSGIANPGRFNEELQSVIEDPNVSDALKAKLYPVQSQMGRQAKTNQQVNQLAAMQGNRDEYGRRVAFSENAIANAYNQMGTMPDVEMVRVTEMIPAPGGGIDTITETIPMSVQQRLNEARDFQQRGYGQLATSLPTENVAGQQMAQIKLGPENLSAMYVYPGNKVMGGNQVVNMIKDGKVEPITVQSNTNYVVRNGSLMEVRPLSPQQQTQVNREIAVGTRQADKAPIGTTNPNISMPNEFMDVDGLGMNQSQQLPVQLGRSPRVESEGIADMTVINPRYDTSQEQMQRTAGQRLRGEAGGYTQGALSDAELARRTQAMLQQKFGDNWRSYLVQ